MPASLRWLGVLVALAVAAALAGGAVLYWQHRSQSRTTAATLAEGDVDAGRRTIERYGCGSCHEIPGVSLASGRVGPSLKGVATRSELAGHLPNDPDAMVRWLIDPQGILPGNGMPNQGVTTPDARDIAAYLYTLR